MLEEKNVLITGAKGGLGTAVTRAFLGAGARVAGVSRSIADTDFPHALFLATPADIGTAEGVRRAWETTLQAFGRVDAVVHLVGGFTSGTNADETSDADVERMLDLNYRSALTLARVVMPYFRQQRAGRFAAIGSRIVEAPAPATAAYAAAKAALVAWMRTLDEEARPLGVRARVLLPDTLTEAETRRVTDELLEFAAS